MSEWFLFRSVIISLVALRALSSYPIYEDLLSRGLNSNLPLNVRVEALQELEQYSSKAPAIINEEMLMDIFNVAFDLEKDQRLILFKILNSVSSLSVLRHYNDALNSDQTVYKFYLISALKGLKLRKEVDNLESEYFKENQNITISLIKQLEHENPNIRFATIKAFAYRKSAPAIEKMLEIFFREQPAIQNEIENTLIKLEASNELERCIESGEGKIYDLCRNLLKKIKIEQRISLSSINAKILIDKFILEKPEVKIIENLKDEKLSMTNKLFLIGVYGYENLPKKLSLDPKNADLCLSAFDLYYQFPKSFHDEVEYEKGLEYFKSCDFFLGKKKVDRAKFYLSLGQRLRNSNNLENAIIIASEVRESYKETFVEVLAMLVLLEANIIKKESKETELLIKQIGERESVLDKEEKLLFKKLIKRAKRI